MAANLEGKDTAWKVPAKCQCGGQVYAYPSEISPGDFFGKGAYVVYSWWCKSCDLEGPWRQLARGILERRGDRRAFK